MEQLWEAIHNCSIAPQARYYGIISLSKQTSIRIKYRYIFIK